MTKLVTSRLISVILTVLLLLVGFKYYQQKQLLEKIDNSASWLYPYIPVLDEDISFETSYRGLKFRGKASTDWEILFVGASEKPEINFMSLYLDKQKGEKVAVDVGASKGQHSLFFAKKADLVISYEPFPPVLEQFREAIKLNEIQNITVRPVGLGVEPATLPFFADDSSEYTGTFVDSGEGSDDSLQLQIVTGDADLRKLGVSGVDVIKIDIEGYEKFALQGLSRTLKTDRPVVVMELIAGLHKEEGIKSEQDLRSVFPENYSFLQFSHYDLYRGDYRLEKLNFSERVGAKMKNKVLLPRNIIAYPEEKRDRIQLEFSSAQKLK